MTLFPAIKKKKKKPDQIAKGILKAFFQCNIQDQSQEINNFH